MTTWVKGPRVRGAGFDQMRAGMRIHEWNMARMLTGIAVRNH
jgi:hypothetical protein